VLKDVLRGLVWAEEALHSPEQTAQAFVDDLLGAIQAATYVPPLPEGVSGIFAGSVVQARGLPFDIVAVLGLAEGEFPATLREDTLLRDRERAELNERLDVRLRLRTESVEARPRGALLLTRPRIADNGALWQPSPFWEDVLRHIQVVPVELATSTRPTPGECASWPEFWQAMAHALPGTGSAAADLSVARRETEARAIRAGAGALAARLKWKPLGSPHEGDLSRWGVHWAHRLGSDHLWSVSQLEAYRRCPYSYLAGRLLRLEPRRGPVEGLDARQFGTLYHRILAALYRAAGPGASLAELLGRLEATAEPILDEAPRREGFRPTAWWQHTRDTMLRNLRNTLRALEAPPVDYFFEQSERSFGWPGTGYPALIVHDESGDAFRLGGIIDRVDQGSDGDLRIIDYKSGGVGTHSAAALVRGEDLQIALYGLAVEQGLVSGSVEEGYYWSVAQARASALRLSTFSLDGREGPRVAAGVAVGHAWQAVHSARAGVFAPTPPPGSCPSYCPAATHCWHYREGWQ
jgi:ATP-dependent helicase/nuclease subunit B